MTVTFVSARNGVFPQGPDALLSVAIPIERPVMRILILFLSILALPATLSAQDARPGQIGALDRIVADIREAREIAKFSTDARVKEQLDLLLARAELAARELQQVAMRQVAVPPRPVAMSMEDFTRFLAALSANKFDDARLATVKTLINAKLTAAQGKQIVQKFSFDKGKEDAAVHIYPMLVDPHLFAHVLEAMTFEKNRSAAMARISR